MDHDHNKASTECFRICAGGLTSASDVLLPRVEGHLVVGVWLHHVVGGSGNDTMVWGAHPRLSGRHPESGGD